MSLPLHVLPLLSPSSVCAVCTPATAAVCVTASAKLNASDQNGVEMSCNDNHLLIDRGSVMNVHNFLCNLNLPDESCVKPMQYAKQLTLFGDRSLCKTLGILLITFL